MLEKVRDVNVNAILNETILLGHDDFNIYLCRNYKYTRATALRAAKIHKRKEVIKVLTSLT